MTESKEEETKQVSAKEKETEESEDYVKAAIKEQARDKILYPLQIFLYAKLLAVTFLLLK